VPRDLHNALKVERLALKPIQGAEFHLVLCQEGKDDIVHGIHAPNGRDLMQGIIEAFRKVFANLEEAIAHADDAIYPGADGALYGAG
jgi:hypothetical protein